MNVSSLDLSDRPAILAHLKRLDTNDRYMRFFAAVNDYALEKYVYELIDFKTSKCYGVFADDQTTLVAFAHFSGIDKDKGELGISVDINHRDKGYAKHLMDRILVFCKATNIKVLFMSCLRQNKKMQSIARKAGLRVVVDHEEAIAELNLSVNPIEKAFYLSKEVSLEQIAIFDKVFRHNNAVISIFFKPGNVQSN